MWNIANHNRLVTRYQIQGLSLCGYPGGPTVKSLWTDQNTKITKCMSLWNGQQGILVSPARPCWKQITIVSRPELLPLHTGFFSLLQICLFSTDRIIIPLIPTHNQTNQTSMTPTLALTWLNRKFGCTAKSARKIACNGTMHAILASI